MKKWIFVLSSFFIFLSSPSMAQSDIGKVLLDKLNLTATYLQNNTHIAKAWELMIDVANIIKAHPEYNDGEVAEGMNEVVTELLQRPWKYGKPYLIGEKSSVTFQSFILGQINELSTTKDLKAIRKNISHNCDQKKFDFCRKLLQKVNDSMTK